MNSAESISLLELIRSKYDLLSPAQRVVGNYILSSYRSLAYVTLAELARLTSTGQGTVVRFAQVLGYGSFSNLQSALREEIGKSAPKTLEIYSSKSSKGEDAAPFDTVFEMERTLMDDTYSLINKEDFYKAVRMISDAPALIIAGTGSNSFLSEYAGYFLGTMKKNVTIIKDTDISDMNILLDAPEGTAAFVFSFPRYPIKTQSIVKVMKERRMGIVGISDSVASPIAEYCDPLFIVPQKFISFMDPSAAVVSVIHSVLYGVWLSDKEGCRKRIESRNSLFKGEKVFVSDNVYLPDLTP
ncbi:MAG: MurR/RpiR family transcriptional regulator [Synergistaceae bacterium]|jgi:DNA-binding MurR/RpiR family transcriptional regulator|nr:MurR/RpiR family transcriptional regulator [Synergistaceae bacterium]MCK9437032.1 MurR/RpiR family transcriptional regulator [Synergistaceae bacterium]MDD2350736.1 MurR/RpiR family transcriptional regulator [Synergistaceae bacterium]MDD3319230.1 MurR/RpiR family transcriptional regulator [Synergistaceae bacterium]MDD3673038.1 MurR/RpiR family transcriptional regulator [Synergistaceae bacterium]